MGTTLVVSPHLDDAVLSIGGSIASWIAAGERVVVATVYTTGPPLDRVAPAMRKFADYEARRAEDAAASAVLGVETRWLGQIERAFRPPYLTGWSFFTTPPDRSGFTTLPAVTAALAPLATLAPDRILIPLGIGNHVDHVETLIAATDWTLVHGLFDRARFYEDFYALSGTMRRRHPVAKQHGWRRWRSPLLKARRLAAILRTIALARRGPELESFLAPALQHASWAHTRSPVTTEAEARQLAAIECYGSQTAAFGGFSGIARATRAYHRRWDRAEPLWHATLGA
ncbi:MAG: PIG-L family deacetylase [Deltaproteobacteria bacterium]|nr:PIG-L family deacetylase [Deltaproteobacteria bacterium]MDQ3300774.1 PIG-L family deacetylase [Myxococcota bacterium]